MRVLWLGASPLRYVEEVESWHDSVMRTYYYGNVFASVFSANKTSFEYYTRLYNFVKGIRGANATATAPSSAVDHGGPSRMCAVRPRAVCRCVLRESDVRRIWVAQWFPGGFCALLVFCARCPGVYMLSVFEAG